MFRLFKKSKPTVEYTACFTGHRPQRFKFRYNENDTECIKLKKQIEKVVDTMIDKGVTTFISGMALGVDMWGAEIVISKKRINKNIKLIAAVPCRGQENKWSQQYKGRYNKILSKADDVIYLANAYTANCMKDRNVYMVDNSDFAIAVYDGSRSGGTYQTVEYAKSNGHKIIVINPDNLDIQKINF